MNRAFALNLALLPLMLVGCGSDGKDKDPSVVYTEFAAEISRETDPNVSDADFDQLVTDNNQFALATYQQILDDSVDGQVISPLSLRSALAMMYAGSEGNTKTEMADALQFSLADEALHSGFNKLFSALESRNIPADENWEALELNINNSLWPKLNAEPNADFLNVLAKNYGKGVYALDYESDPEEARQAINNQVEEWTEGKIEDLLPDGSVQSDTLMVLTSTIYLYAPWNTPFVPEATDAKTFTNLDGTTSEVDTMRGDISLYHGRLDDAQIVSLPFRGEELEMVFLVPADDFTGYVSDLNAVNLDDALDDLTRERAYLNLPKFKLEYTMPAVETLQGMGMQQAFTQTAQFEPVGLGPMMITEVAHKAFIEVNEDGTEAAAATAVVGGPTSVPSLEINVDKPFVFMIRDSVTGALLFIGHVASL